MTFANISFYTIITKQPLKDIRSSFSKEQQGSSKECYRQQSLQYLCLLLLEKDHKWKALKAKVLIGSLEEHQKVFL